MALEPPKLEDSTVENEEVWTLARISSYRHYRHVTTNAGPTTYAENLVSYPQTISTNNQPNLSQATAIFTPLGRKAVDFSFTENSGEWFGNLNTGVWLGITGTPSDFSQFTAQQFVLDPQEEGGFVAYSNEYPGAIGQGETEAEALRDLQEAIDLLKEVLEQDREQK